MATEKNIIKKRRYRHFFGMRNYIFENYEPQVDENGQEVKDDKNKAVLVPKKDCLSELEWREKVTAELLDSVACDNYNEIFIMFHDRDLTDDESRELKPLHVHYVVSYENARYLDSIATVMKTDKRNLFNTASRSSALLYLTHTTPESIKAKKTRYNVSEMYIKTNMYLNEKSDSGIIEIPRELNDEEKELHYRLNIAGKLVKKSPAEQQKEIVDSICIKVMAGEITTTQVLDELEVETDDVNLAFRLWVDNKKRFEEAEREYQARVYQNLLKTGRELNTVYIQGDGGIGKTSIARKILLKYLNSRGYHENSKHGRIHMVANAGGRKLDFLSGYDFQVATLFDDLSAEAFDYYEFLNVFDKTQMNLYSSRFNNKPWFSELAIITRSTAIKQYIEGLCAKPIEKLFKGIVDDDIKDLIMEDATLPLNDKNRDRQQEYRNILYQVQRRFSIILEITQSRLKRPLDNHLTCEIVDDEADTGYYVFKMYKYIKKQGTDKAVLTTLKEYRSAYKVEEYLYSEGEKAEEMRDSFINEVYEELDLHNIFNNQESDLLKNIDDNNSNVEKYKELLTKTSEIKKEFYLFNYLTQTHENARKWNNINDLPIEISVSDVLYGFYVTEKATVVDLEYYPLNDFAIDLDNLEFAINVYYSKLFDRLNTKEYKSYIKGQPHQTKLFNMLKKRIKDFTLPTYQALEEYANTRQDEEAQNDESL